jgi:PleD family two-component response regulator/EAL domain-containing protein (putative c-di-GMP-specific phosphodiesterase class I)
VSVKPPAAQNAHTLAGTPATVARAEAPPLQYWRRWCEDAGAPLAAGTESETNTEAPVPAPAPQRQAKPADAATTAAEAPYRVLIVEDDISQALFAESILMGAGMQAAVVLATTEVMAAMERFRPELVLMDLHMPGMDGTELTTMIRRHEAFAHVPVVFLTGDTDPERHLQALEVGADDFLAKPVPPRHLIAAVQSRVKRARMLQRQRSGEGRHPTTGLYTRPHMLNRLNTAIPGPAEGAVCFLEIENFAALRDRLGYARIEVLLAEAGRHLGQLAGDDAVSRLNDNTFVLHAATLTDVALEAWARKLRDGLGRHVFTSDGESLRLRAQVGYTALAHGFEDASSALAAAEQALREARNTTTGIAAYAPPAPGQARRDQTLGDIVTEAMAADRLELAFQPIVAVAGGDEAQYQTLLRVRDADGKLYTAGAVLPAIEAAGTIGEVDQKVVRLAVEVLRRREHEKRPVRLFVSQSPRTLAHEGHADWLLETLALAELTQGSLVVDIRLDDALLHALSVEEFCAAMVPAGVQLCLSQYRHGDEADALLARLPLGFVRLSADYSRQLEERPVHDEMRTVIERAHRLGLQVIGQHVEEPQAAATLWMSGIDYIQGNLVQHVAEGLDFDFQHAVI